MKINYNIASFCIPLFLYQPNISIVAILTSSNRITWMPLRFVVLLVDSLNGGSSANIVRNTGELKRRMCFSFGQATSSSVGTRLSSVRTTKSIWRSPSGSITATDDATCLSSPPLISNGLGPPPNAEGWSRQIQKGSLLPWCMSLGSPGGAPYCNATSNRRLYLWGSRGTHQDGSHNVCVRDSSHGLK